MSFVGIRKIIFGDSPVDQEIVIMKFLHNDSICITNVAEQQLKVSSQRGYFA
jgi:hypothetical protein